MGLFDKIAAKFQDSVDGGLNKKIEQPSDQTTDEIKLANFVKSRVEEVRGQSNRVALESLWMRNTAAVMGFTGIYWDATSRQYKPVDSKATALRRNRLHSNLILPACQNRLARLCKNPPMYEVEPNSMAEEDKDAAELALDVLNNIWDEQRINLKRIGAYMYMQQCGHVWMTVCFDDTLGEDMKDPETGESMGKEGAVKVDVVSPFEVFVDPLAKTEEDIQWLCRAKLRKLDYFKKHFPEKGDAVKEEGAWLISTQYDMRINTLNNAAQGPGGGPIADQMKNAAIELSYYETSSIDHPNGRHIIVANGVLLKDDELPVGEIPFAKWDDILIGGKFYPEATVTHAVPLQEQYNRNLQKYSDWTNKLLAGKYIAARGHGLQQESINDQNGEVVEYDFVPNCPPPAAMQIPVMPQYVLAQQDAIEKDLNQVFGLSDVSRGIMPSAGIPAVGMQLLVTQDETRIGIEVEQHEHAYAKLGGLILRYVQEYYVTQRKLRMKRDGKYMVKDFSGDDIKGNVMAKVIKGSTIPNNLFIKRQEIMNAFGQGLLGDPMAPTTKERVLNDLQYGQTEEIWKDVRLDKAQVKRHMDMIVIKGEMPTVDEMDNHDMFIKEINDFRKTEEFDVLDSTKQSMLLTLREFHVQAKTRMLSPQLPPDDSDLDMHDQVDAQQVDSTNNMNELDQKQQNAEEAGAPPPTAPPAIQGGNANVQS